MVKNTEHENVQIEYDGQLIEVSYNVAAALSESDKSMNAQRRQKRRRNSYMQVNDAIDNLASGRLSEFEDDIVSRLDMQEFRDALAKIKLTEPQRRRLTMYFFESLTYREIADRESINVKSAFESVQYALKKIKKYFKNTQQDTL